MGSVETGNTPQLREKGRTIELLPVSLKTAFTLELPALFADPGHPSKKITIPECLHLGDVKEVMTRQTEAVVLDGKTIARAHRIPTEHGIKRIVRVPGKADQLMYETRPQGEEPYHNNALLDRVTAAAVVPVGRWGEHAMLIQDFNPADTLLTDMSAERLPLFMGLVAETMKSLRDDGQEPQPVQFGMCVSPASMNKEHAVSGQSVLAPHGQVTTNPSLRGITNEDITDVRDKQEWDHGISEVLGARLVSAVANQYKELYPHMTSSKDPMGARFRLPGLTIDDLASLEFVDGVLRPLFSAAQEQVTATHNAVFTGTWEDALAAVQAEKQKGKVENRDLNAYNQLFTKKPLENALQESPLPEEVTRSLHALHDADALRWPPGWSFALRFAEGQDPLLAVTFGVGKLNHGPDEGIGIQLSRPTHEIESDERDSELFYLGRHMDSVVSALKK